MQCFKCDYCYSLKTGEPVVRVTGYKAPGAPGLMLPEAMQEHEFCGSACFASWMRHQLLYDDRGETPEQTSNRCPP